MPQGFLPASDSKLLLWAENFFANMMLLAGVLDIPGAETAAFENLLQTYRDALAKCDPGERSKSLTAAKNAARDALKNDARRLAKFLESRANITNQMKIDLGLNVRKQPTPTPVPNHAPIIDVISADGRNITVDLRQGKNTKGKPKGCQGANIFVAYGEEPPTEVNGWMFETGTGKTRVTLPLGNSDEAQTAWLTAFWFNGRKQSSQATQPPVRVNLPAVNVMPKSASQSKKKAA